MAQLINYKKVGPNRVIGIIVIVVILLALIKIIINKIF